MGDLRKRGASSSITTHLSSTLMRGIQEPVIEGSTKTEDRVFGNLQSPLLSIHPVVVRVSGTLMT